MSTDTKKRKSGSRKNRKRKQDRLQNAEYSRRRRRRRRKKQSTGRKLCLILIGLLLLAGVIGFLLWYFSFERLDLEDYVDVSYSGYDTEGTVSLAIKESDEYDTFFKNVEVRLLSENGSLRNGDSLEVQFIYDQEAAKEQKLRIEADDCQIEVTGLPEGKKLSTEDLFENVHISYEGTAPELSVTVTNESTDPFLRTVSYEIQEEQPFYDVGDTIVIKAVFSEEDAVANEYIVSSADSYTKEYSVENMDRYLRDASQLSSELMDTLNETAATLFGDATEYGLRIFSEANLMPIWVNGKTTFVWSNPRLISAYLNVLKPEYFGTLQSHDNDIKLVYVATLSQADGVACDAEVVVQFNNLLQKADGTYDLALDSGRIIAASYKNSHIKDLVTDSYNEEYEAEKLELN